MDCTIQERLTLLSLLPQETGSIEESIRTRELKQKIEPSSAEAEQINLSASPNGVQFDPTKAKELGAVEIELSNKDREIIAYGFIIDEQQESVPTDDTYLDLYDEFKEEVQSCRENVQ